MQHNSRTLSSEDRDPLELLRERAEYFSKTFASAAYEKQQAQTFIIKLCDVFGLDSVRNVSLEHRVKKASGKGMNFMDGFFPGLLLIEMKSKGEDLSKAYKQAKSYIELLKNPEEMPRYILVCDFQTFHVYDLNASNVANTTEPAPTAFSLADLRKHVGKDEALGFLSNYERVYQEVQVRITTRAAKVLTDLHDALKKARYPAQDMQTFLVRILFCLFADDTDIFNVAIDDSSKAQASHFTDQPFYDLIQKSPSNGEYLGDAIARMFTRLNTLGTFVERNPVPYEQLTSGEKSMYYFPYVNGALFAGEPAIAIANFDEHTRRVLLDCCATDWSLISPDIFGTMFQNLMHYDDETAGKKGGKRREHGAHYTSERNILRAIRPLFIDDLYAELKQARSVLADETAKKLRETKKALTPAARKKACADLIALYDKLPTLTVLDPACGCGNFLVVAYRELRRLEAELIADIFDERTLGKGLLDVKTLSKVNVEQFYGIELDPTAAEIAKVALWLTDHQLNRQLAERFGTSRPTIPLTKAAHIAKGQNALTLDWNSLLPANQCHFIVGNPPFLGKSQQNASQKADMAAVFAAYKNYGVLDYVSAWYVKAVAHMQRNPAIKAAFVSTNSITQGEQVAVLWQPLMQASVHIQFAHRTFKWNNEGSSVAAVHCVIIGFGLDKPVRPPLWDYGDDVSALEGNLQKTRRINPYLVDAPIVFLNKRKDSICMVQKMQYGSMPIDNGHLIVSPEEYELALSEDAENAILIRPYTGGDEFLNNLNRYCLWLQNISISVIDSSKFANERIAKTKHFRLNSGRENTRKLAEKPHLFGEIRQPMSDYLLIPKVSSENRQFMPIGFVDKNMIVSGSALIIPMATKYHFAVLHSTMTMRGCAPYVAE
jgi:type I restriction-modification system DNA methylase subunit